MVYISALIIALFVLLLFSPRYIKGASIVPILVFFLVLFLAGIASRYWITPFGPVLWGVSWVPMLIIIVVVALLFSAPSPYHHHRSKKEDSNLENASELAAVGTLVWILISVLVGLIIAGILLRPS